MRYKTIILELLKDQFPVLYDRLCRERTLLSSLDQYAMDLKYAHVSWMKELRRANPRRSQDRIASEALELALNELENRLPSASNLDEDEALSLDKAMAHIQSHTSRG